MAWPSPDRARYWAVVFVRSFECVIGAALALAAIGGCDPGDPSPTAAREASLASPTRAPDIVVADKATVHEARRGRIVGGEPLPRRVVWPDAESLDEDLRSTLGPALLRRVATAPAPVYFPSAPAWAVSELDSAALHRGEHWFALELHRGDAHLNFSASTLSRLHAQLTGDALAEAQALSQRDVLRGRPALVTRNEGIWSGSWIEGGVAYSLELECGAQSQACVDDRELRSVAESLAYVGGRAEAGR